MPINTALSLMRQEYIQQSKPSVLEALDGEALETALGRPSPGPILITSSLHSKIMRGLDTFRVYQFKGQLGRRV